MLLSSIIKESGIIPESEMRLKNEKEFDQLGLVVTHTGKRICAFLDDEKYLKNMSDDIVMVICTASIASKVQNMGICVVADPRILFFRLHNFLSEQAWYRRIDFPTILGNNCAISKMSFIPQKNVIIGDNVTIEEFVSIKEHSVIGEGSIVHSNCVIGEAGYEFKRLQDGILSVKHIGGTIVGKQVEIFSGSTIARAVYPWDNTIVGDNCKVDCMAHIAHGAKIGKNVLILAGATITGRVQVGDGSKIGPGVCVRNGVIIGKGVKASMGAIVTTDLEDCSVVSGNFAIDHEKFINVMKKIR